MSEILTNQLELEAELASQAVIDKESLSAVASVINPEAARFVTAISTPEAAFIPAYTAYLLDREGSIIEYPVITGVNQDNAEAFTAGAEQVSRIYTEGNPLIRATAVMMFSEEGLLSGMHEELTEGSGSSGPVLLGGGMMVYGSKSDGVKGADFVGIDFAEQMGDATDLADMVGLNRNMLDTMLDTLESPQAQAVKPLLDIYDVDEVMDMMLAKSILSIMATKAVRNSAGVISTPKILRPRLS